LKVATLVRLSLGATCLLSAKTAKEQNMVRKLEFVINEGKMKEK